MYLAIDIGGTKTLIALFSKRGRVIRRYKFKTAHGSQTFIHDLTLHLGDFQKFDIERVIVAIPGLVQNNYTVHFGNRNWPNIDLFTPIKNLFNCPIHFENDASLGALFEGRYLRGRTIFLTFSTGIGGGIVENNHIIPESSVFEPGHKIYTYQGTTREWEDIAAASAINSYYHVERSSQLRKKNILRDIAGRIYLGLPEIIAEYHPDTIILGGPIGTIFRSFQKYIPDVSGVQLKRPKRPNESVIYGCYILACQYKKETPMAIGQLSVPEATPRAESENISLHPAYSVNITNDKEDPHSSQNQELQADTQAEEDKEDVLQDQIQARELQPKETTETVTPPSGMGKKRELVTSADDDEMALDIDEEIANEFLEVFKSLPTGIIAGVTDKD